MEQQETFGIDMSQRLDRWHPKLTPFRLLTLGTTIALGTAKAVESYKQVTYVSVTLEWVLGVVAFLMYVYFLSLFITYPIVSADIILLVVLKRPRQRTRNTCLGSSRLIAWMPFGGFWLSLAFPVQPTRVKNERSRSILTSDNRP